MADPPDLPLPPRLAARSAWSGNLLWSTWTPATCQVCRPDS